MDFKKITFFNMSGIYQKQEFYRQAVKEYAHVIQGQHIKGTDCYCDDEAAKLLAQNIENEDECGIHYLDSGNYHYISYLWLKKIAVDFELILFDNHPDMQPSLFGDILSCGSWVKDALSACSSLKHVWCIGVNDELLTDDMLQNERVTFISRQQLEKGSFSELINEITKEPKGQLPVYISVDKDVLSESEVATNWDQGTLSTEQLFTILQRLFDKRRVLGMDICGEPANEDLVSEEVLRKTSELNSQFMYFINNLEKNER